MRVLGLVVAVSGALALAIFAAQGRSSLPSSARGPSVSSLPAIQLPILAHLRGPNDPHDFDLGVLVPVHARVRQVWFIHGGTKPDQVLVEWIKSTTRSVYTDAYRDSVPWGLTLWTQTPRKPANFEAPWIGTAIPLLRTAPGAPDLRVAVADVTSDGHPDVLVEQYPHTNHGCGPHEIVATLASGRSWRVFSAELCETSLEGSRGLLKLDLPYYLPGDSVCCWSKTEHLLLRWSGGRYVTVSRRITRTIR